MPIGFSLRKVLLDASLLKSFERLLAGNEYDVVHAVEEAAWLAAMLCPIKGVPFIYDMASAIPEQLLGHQVLGRLPAQAVLRGTELRVVNRAAHVVCSGGLGSRVSAMAPCVPVTEWRFPAQQTPAEPGAAAALRREHNILDDHRVLLYTGSFVSYQGMEVLLDAFARAAATDSRLMLVCVGARDAQEAGEVLQRLPSALRDRARILPREKRAMMPAWFEAAHCLMSLRTCGENIPLKIFEYMAARKPIIASRGPAHEPLLNDARAYLCAPHSDDVAASICRVFADPERSHNVADAAANYATQNFSWPRFRQLVTGVYGRVRESTVQASARTTVRQHWSGRRYGSGRSRH